MQTTATNGRDTLQSREECSRWLSGVVGSRGGVGISTLRALESRGGVEPVVLGGPPKYDSRSRFAALVGSRLLALGGPEEHIAGLGARISAAWSEMETTPPPWNLGIEAGRITIQAADRLTVPKGNAAESPTVFVVLGADRLWRRCLAA